VQEGERNVERLTSGGVAPGAANPGVEGAQRPTRAYAAHVVAYELVSTSGNIKFGAERIGHGVPHLALADACNTAHIHAMLMRRLRQVAEPGSSMPVVGRSAQDLTSVDDRRGAGLDSSVVEQSKRLHSG
jgi:hypothetical protein